MVWVILVGGGGGCGVMLVAEIVCGRVSWIGCLVLCW